MILVDTSVLVDFLRNKRNDKIDLFEDILEKRIPWGINEHIYQEVLQGARDEKEFEKLREYFDTIPVYSLRYGKSSFERAAMMNVTCRHSGVTVRSTIDLLIAEAAIENDVALLHNDGDFENIGRIVEELRLYKEKLI